MVRSQRTRHRAENKGEKRTPASEPQENLTTLRKPDGAQLADFRLSAGPLRPPEQRLAVTKTGGQPPIISVWFLAGNGRAASICG